jgi:hypothetical protein
MLSARDPTMRHWLLALVLLAMPLAALHAGKDDPAQVPRCGGPFQLCGYGEKGSQTPRIPERFEVARPFSEGLAAVRIDGLFGYIDPSGKVVIAPRFQDAGQFAGDYAEVRLEGASGIIDRSGRLIVPARFGRIIPFAGGAFIAEPLPVGGSAGAASDVRLEGFSDPLGFLNLKRAGLYHVRRGWLTAQDLQFALFDVPERGLVWAGKRNEQGEEQWGLLRSDGTWQVSPRYSHVQRLMETRAIVRSMPEGSLPPQERRDGVLSGAVDRDGRLVVPLKYAHLSYWRGGYGIAREAKPYRPDGSSSGAREGLVRADGTLLAGRYFDKTDIREDGSLPRARIGATWYSVEPDGRLVPDRFDGTPMVECAGGLAIVERGDAVEFRRPDGRSIGRFDEGYFNKRDCPGPFSAKRDGKWFIVLEDGAVLGGKAGFDNTYAFGKTHAAVQVDGRWGIIDRSGGYTVTPRFAKLRPDREGVFAVGEGDETYWIDASGARVEKPTDRIDPAQALTCKGGLRFFREAGLWGFRDGNGNTVIEPRFRALSCFAQGVSWTAEPGGKGWCPVGPDGQRREAMACSETHYPVIVTEHYPERFSENPFESSVLWNRAWLEYQAGEREKPPQWISRFGGGAYSVMPGAPLGKVIGAASVDRTDIPLVAGVGLLLLGGGVWWRLRA